MLSLDSNSSGAPGISLPKSRDIPPKKFVFPGCRVEGHAEVFGLHPFTWKTPTPAEGMQTQKFEFVLLFLPETSSVGFTGGGGSLWKMRDGEGGGVGTGKGTGKSMRTCLSKLPFSKLPFTITHKMIAEPNFIIFELFSVIPAL